MLYLLSVFNKKNMNKDFKTISRLLSSPLIISLPFFNVSKKAFVKIIQHTYLFCPSMTEVYLDVMYKEYECFTHQLKKNHSTAGKSAIFILGANNWQRHAPIQPNRITKKNLTHHFRSRSQKQTNIDTYHIKLTKPAVIHFNSQHCLN